MTEQVMVIFHAMTKSLLTIHCYDYHITAAAKADTIHGHYTASTLVVTC